MILREDGLESGAGRLAAPGPPHGAGQRLAVPALVQQHHIHIAPRSAAAKRVNRLRAADAREGVQPARRLATLTHDEPATRNTNSRRTRGHARSPPTGRQARPGKRPGLAVQAARRAWPEALHTAVSCAVAGCCSALALSRVTWMPASALRRSLSSRSPMASRYMALYSPADATATRQELHATAVTALRALEAAASVTEATGPGRPHAGHRPCPGPRSCQQRHALGRARGGQRATCGRTALPAPERAAVRRCRPLNVRPYGAAGP
jgi:hypothetical protein